MNLNRASLIGRVTKDPEAKKLPSGITVCSFSLATNRTWKNKEGEKQEETDFHNLVAFGKQADTIGMYVKKGHLLYLDGRIQTRSYEVEGRKIYRTEIIVENFQFGPKPAYGAAPQREESAEAQVEDEEINPDDIPF